MSGAVSGGLAGPDDGATPDHLLALVREAYADPTITTWHYPSGGGPDRKRWRVWRKGQPIAYGVTEAEALVTALERSAAPLVGPELVAVAPLVKA